MKMQNRNKLNQMFQQWPACGLATAAFLRGMGISSALLHHYTQRRWLDQVARGVYRRPSDAPGWQASLVTAQGQEGIPLHVGGLSALELHGYGHYAGERPLFVFAPAGVRMPAWLAEAAGRHIVPSTTDFLEKASGSTIESLVSEGVALPVSTPERAALEMLYHVPRYVGVAEAMEVMGGLAWMRGEVLQPLLEVCSNIKVKRLFLYCAREAGHAWYAGLEKGRIDLGFGKRELVKGGRLDKEFLLTVPQRAYAMESHF